MLTSARRKKIAVLILVMVILIYAIPYGLQRKEAPPKPLTSGHFANSVKEWDDDEDESVSSFSAREKDGSGRILFNSTSSQQHLERSESFDGKCFVVHPMKGPSTINTGEVYPHLQFNVSQNNFWDESFEAKYLEKKSKGRELPLKVIVMPFSHTDPGWLQTFEGYFRGSVAKTLDNMVAKLQKYPDFTFIWSEISFLAKWWESLAKRPHTREAVKKLVAKGQLEIVSGGWVMTDEAGTSYYAMVDQLIEGHQWLRSTFGSAFKEPTNGWSIDPFGHSTTFPYILRKAGIGNTVIQRTHYGWKQRMAQKEQLEFWWKQAWERSPATSGLNKTGIYCHLAPFDLYSIKYSCGPDTNICLQYDFRKIGGEYSESRSIPINKQNVAEKARLLVSQYSRTASLYRHNVALIPLGDDFRFNVHLEWDQQRNNYKLLFDYINSNPSLFNGTQIMFGTLKDYFDAVHERIDDNPDQVAPELEGDFFPYGDNYADSRPKYWTGYYSTRPFWKAMARDVENWLRNAEITFTLALNYGRRRADLRSFLRDYTLLTSVRTNLGLFQHHDALTGTSKEYVMYDYGQRLHESLIQATDIVSRSLQYLRLMDLNHFEDLLNTQNAPGLQPLVERNRWDEPSRRVPLSPPSAGGIKLVVFNSQATPRAELIRIMVTDSSIVVADASTGLELPVQINPVFRNNSAFIETDLFEAVFVPLLPSLSLNTFVVSQRKGHFKANSVSVSVFIGDAGGDDPALGTDYLPYEKIFTFKNFVNSDIEISSPHLTATFDKDSGLLSSITDRVSGMRRKVSVSFAVYRSEDSGAYIFSPNSVFNLTSDIMGRFPVIKLIRGDLASEIVIEYSNFMHIVYRVHNSKSALGAGVEAEVTFDAKEWTRLSDCELVMRIQTDIDNKDKDSGLRLFNTDSNGFQMMRRDFVEENGVKVEANYYPMTSAVFIEDPKSRLTVLSSHSLGVTSPFSGALEMMLERKLTQDDRRGLGEGVLDNKRTVAHFWLLSEEVSDGVGVNEVPNLSVTSHALSVILSYPSVVLTEKGVEERPHYLNMLFLNQSFPSQLIVVNFRTLPEVNDYKYPSNSSLLILHNKGISCSVRRTVTSPPLSADPNQSKDQFPLRLSYLKVDIVRETSLTGTKDGDKLDPNRADLLKVPLMDLASYKVTFV